MQKYRLFFAGAAIGAAILFFGSLLIPVVSPAREPYALEMEENLASQNASALYTQARNTANSARNLVGDINREYANQSPELNSNNRERIARAGRLIRAKEERAYNEFMNAINLYNQSINAYQQCINIVIRANRSPEPYRTRINSIQQEIMFVQNEANKMRAFWSGYQWYNM